MLWIFEYGADMSAGRMGRRVPGAGCRGPGWLPGWRLICNHRSADGSVRANLRPDATATVWGVVFTLAGGPQAAERWLQPGYRAVQVEVVDTTGRPRDCQAQIAEQTDRSQPLVDWVKRAMVQGARAQDLPRAYQRALQVLPSTPGPLPGCGCPR